MAPQRARACAARGSRSARCSRAAAAARRRPRPPPSSCAAVDEQLVTRLRLAHEPAHQARSRSGLRRARARSRRRARPPASSTSATQSLPRPSRQHVARAPRRRAWRSPAAERRRQRAREPVRPGTAPTRWSTSPMTATATAGDRRARAGRARRRRAPAITPASATSSGRSRRSPGAADVRDAVRRRGAAELLALLGRQDREGILAALEGDERLRDRRVELRADVALDLRERLLDAQAGAVGPVAGHRVEAVGDDEEVRRERLVGRRGCRSSRGRRSARGGTRRRAPRRRRPRSGAAAAPRAAARARPRPTRSAVSLPGLLSTAASTATLPRSCSRAAQRRRSMSE